MSREANVGPKRPLGQTTLPEQERPLKLANKMVGTEQKITEKIGTAGPETKIPRKAESTRPKAQPANQAQPHLAQGYAAKIRQAISGLKNEPFTSEHLNYSKYQRFNTKPDIKAPQDARELRVEALNPTTDDLDLRRALVDLKIPFHFKTDHKDEVSGLFREGKLSLLIRGKPDQLPEWKQSMLKKGFKMTEIAAKFPISSGFTDARIHTENIANGFMESRNEIKESVKSLTKRKKELLDEWEKIRKENESNQNINVN
jgi:hypothetical protein